MIARITGNLLELDSDSNTVLLEVGDIAYEIMVPGYAVSDLSQKINHTITLYCLEYFLETEGLLQGPLGSQTLCNLKKIEISHMTATRHCNNFYVGKFAPEIHNGF